MSITHKELIEILDYNPITGLFHWRVDMSSRAKAGKQAGSISKVSGYVEIRIRKILYYGHRLAWFYTHGYWPIAVDHRNLCRSHNRLTNLREATQTQNNRSTSLRRNNSTGFKGVHVLSGGKYCASITYNCEHIHIGVFAEPIDAAEAYDQKAIELYKSFAMTNQMLGLIL